jgi:predicted aldo/keto reductase-like oxidoreductase
MQVPTRDFGKLDFRASALGFGAMRLPVVDGQAGRIDEPAAAAMIHEAVERGVNYLDTAYPYHEGESEAALGRILTAGGLRGRVKLATKQPCWLVEKAADFDRYLDEQLRRLQTDHVDFYLLHALFSQRWESVRRLGVLEWAERAIRQGKIGHLGFSFHDGPEVFKEIVDAWDGWALAQIQYNYVNEEVQAGRAGLSYAAERGLAVVVMEPLLGGMLARPPAQVARAFADAGADPADLALRWLWDQPGVSCVLSGMSTLEQTRRNLASAARSGVGPLGEAERRLVTAAREAYRARTPIPCTRCRYCLPCPSGVDIPYNIEIYSEAVVHENESLSKALYNWHVPDPKKASACRACGDCETRCPQHIPISEWMPRIHDRLAFAAGG